ncbi:MAG TPA: M1 family metallopeptidase, partial [Gemmatimonadaceae bacterium]|nr:M1 family metallopeptidase [Gemmatimonadaceae bacterium]
SSRRSRFHRAGLASAMAMVSACSSGARPAATPAATRAAATAGERPIPYPLAETPAFRRAVERGTRTRTGTPGPKYWTQYARYALRAELDPATRRLTGEGRVRYQNRSPDTLRFIPVHLHQNLFAPGAARNVEVPATTGMELTRVVAQGRPLPQLRDVESSVQAGFQIEGTIARIRLATPVAPGGSAELEFSWSYTVPADGAPRSGTDGEVFMVSYWYPQVAVYDDVNGWQTDWYMGNAEFYMGYADYDVALTVPAGWLIGATGELKNPNDVLTPAARERLAQARRGPNVVHIVGESDRGAGRATTNGSGGKVTWLFEARNVRDFAWGTSDKYLWDATFAVVGDVGCLPAPRSGGAVVAATPGVGCDGHSDTTTINSFYRPSRVEWAWDQSARYARHSIEFLSVFLWPYPYPQATALDGVVSCSGMEYPMLTCIGGQRDTLGLYSVMVHELAHMWFPMQVGSDERRHAWQDEGVTRFNQAQAMRAFFSGYDLERIVRDDYLGVARAGGETELMRHGDLYPVGTSGYRIASYQKMATLMVALRALLGDEVFMNAYREYGRRWINKHPTAFDFFHTFDEVSERDLSWFWRTWFYETWTLDQAIVSVQPSGDSTFVTVEDKGLAPMPVRLAITRQGRSGVERREIPVDVWLRGERRTTIKIGSSPRITKVEIDPEGAFPDIDRTNNRWGR